MSQCGIADNAPSDIRNTHRVFNTTPLIDWQLRAHWAWVFEDVEFRIVFSRQAFGCESLEGLFRHSISVHLSAGMCPCDNR